MSDTITPAEYATNLRALVTTAELGPVEWAGPIPNVDEWLAGNQERTDDHGDAGLPGYCVQSADGEIIVAFTGTGPHAAAYAALIAYLLNGASAIADQITLAAPAEGLRLDPNSPEDVERLAQALCRRDGYVWTNEPEWQREEWKGKARDLLRALYNIDRERAALEANHD